MVSGEKKRRKEAAGPGDLSYADGYAPRWDSFGRQFEHLGAKIPAAFCPGEVAVSPR